jgi:aspartate racemase
MSQKVVGVLGGMGPMSTVDLFARIVRATPVGREDDHLRILIDNNPKIPNRTDALLSGEIEPVVEGLCETARNLERAGADVIGIPCNTAHAFLPQIRSSVAVPVLDMVDEAAQEARRLFGERTMVGLLATEGTLSTGLYREALDRYGLVEAAPAPEAQAAVGGVIHEIKRRGVSPGCMEKLTEPIADLTEQGASGLIPGCTEISLVFSSHSPELPWLDPLQTLAEALVTAATNQPPNL